MEIFLESKNDNGLSVEEIKVAVAKSIEGGMYNGKKLNKVLIVPPDFTRFHSNSGLITNIYYHLLKDICEVDILTALGTHFPMTKEECEKMFGDIPFEKFIVQNR
jgi:nickel-dependent lactate racemase